MTKILLIVLFLNKKIAVLCQEAGHPNTLIRIPCHELESWFLGDLVAIDKVYGTHLQGMQAKRKFRDPDKLGNPKDHHRMARTQVEWVSCQRGHDINTQRGTLTKNFKSV